MGFDGVVKVDEAPQLQPTFVIVLELDFLVPHFHQGADDPLGLAVGLWAVDLGELLPDAVGLAGVDECVAVGAPVFLAIVPSGA